MNPTNIVETLNTNPLFADIIDIIKSGKFIAPSQDPITGEGIEFLGEMSILEKALYTALSQYKTQYEEIAATLNRDRGHNPQDIEMRVNYNLLKKRAEATMTHLYTSIEERFAKEYYEMKISKKGEIWLGIYSDFSINVLWESSPGGIAFIAIEIGHHCGDPDCQKCNPQ